MNHFHMREWIDDLRANPDKQGKNRLTGIIDGIERDCCLGRVCKLAKLERVIMPSESEIQSVQYISGTEYSDIIGSGSSETDLPRSAKLWLDSQLGDPYIIDIAPLCFAEKIHDMNENEDKWYESEDESAIIASSANDDYDFTFSQIADCLEWNYMYVDGKLIV